MDILRTALSDLLNAGMCGKVSTSRLTALASVANALSKVIEGTEIERRLEQLEEQTKRGN